MKALYYSRKKSKMAEEMKTSNVHDDLDDLLAEVADAHLPGYTGQAEAQDDTAGMTAAQKKRRKKKNKKKEKMAEAQAEQQKFTDEAIRQQ